MKKGVIIFIVAQFILLASIGTIVVLRTGNQNKTAYIEVAAVYDAFKMKKELEGKFSKVEMFRKSILDSLELNLQLLNNEYQITKSENAKNVLIKKKQEYLSTKQKFEEDNAAVSQQYTDQIFKQLNLYITEYGKEHGYSYIFGAEGSGSLMYANDSENITADITTFINEKYKGVN
ncbi:MAG: OmpH family outer membrane protein [Bacteroidia bacterium]|nr:OmpH family outer membrane protein [Bacteroidia bacterium]